MSTRKPDGRGKDHEAAQKDAFDLDDIDVVFDDEAFDAAWDGERAEAVNVLREALPEIRQLPIPRAVLRDAATAVRRSLAGGGWIHTAMRRAAGWAPKRLPKDDLKLWLGAAGGLIEARDETGMGVEDESALMALEVADWLGAVLGLVRAGVGAPADPVDLLRYVDECPELDGERDEDDDPVLLLAFELVLPAWEAAGAIDRHRRLTELGRWGLPRALAWAWGDDFDASGTLADDRPEARTELSEVDAMGLAVEVQHTIRPRPSR